MIVEAKKVLVKPRPLHKPSSMSQAQQIIVLPSNLLLNSKGGQETVLRLSKAPPVIGTKIVLPSQNKINVVKAIKRPATPTTLDQENFDQTSATPRKRANLDHMTPEEKMMRRKLKNRVAAQNARDKKRIKMDEMEEKLKQLEDDNKRIRQENSNLLALNKRLMEENQAMSLTSGILPPTPPPSETAPASPSGSCASSLSSHGQSLVEQRSVESAEETGSMFGRGPESPVRTLLDVFDDVDGTSSSFGGQGWRCDDDGLAGEMVSQCEAVAEVDMQEEAAVESDGTMLADLDSWLESLSSNMVSSKTLPLVEIKPEPTEVKTEPSDLDFDTCFGELFPDLAC